MSVDLPEEVIAHANRLAIADEDAAAVIAQALSALESQRAEISAVQEGMADYEAGRHRPYQEFAAEILAERGIPPTR